MSVVAFDTETARFRPSCMAPALVCVTWQCDGSAAQIVDATMAEPVLEGLLRGTGMIVGHNVAYDMAVVCERYPRLRRLVFAAYAADRVTDTLTRESLIDIARGSYRGRLGEKGFWITFEYTLEAVAKRRADIRLLKDGWRMAYGDFLDTPLADWPVRAREVQAAAKPRSLALREELLAAEARKDKAAAKALRKELDGLLEMIAGDPMRCAEYPLDDARATLSVYRAQEKHAAFLKDQFRQTRAAFALHLSSAWGLRTDAVGVEMLRAATQAAYDALEDELIELGFIRNNLKRTRDTKVAKARMIAVCARDGLPLRRTESHTKDSLKCRDLAGKLLPGGHPDCAEHVTLDAEACEATEDPVLMNYSEVSTLKKVLTNDLVALARGITHPVHTRYGLAETGRTTSSKPPIQNLRRLAGIREAFVPRAGHVFFSADFPALEAYTWAQCCMSWLGRSKMAEALKAGLDPHLIHASVILGVSYDVVRDRYRAYDAAVAKNAAVAPAEQETADIRQLAKVGNFGWPGGMGPPTMLASVKKQIKPDVIARLGLDLPRMVRLRDEWKATWPEAQPYFDRVKSMGPPYPAKYSASVVTLFTERHRGNASYCAACNNGFQALGADCAKEAAWRICREQYDDGVAPTALFNTRTVAFVHDEFIGEAVEAVAHEAAMRLADVMVEGANLYLPDVPIVRTKVKPSLMRRWSKDAKPVFVDGRLVPWMAEAA